MRLLDRYLLRELLVPFGYCLGSILIFWVTSELFKDLGDFQRNGMQVADIAEYYLVKMPDLLGYVLPIALLLAAYMVLVCAVPVRGVYRILVVILQQLLQ